MRNLYRAALVLALLGGSLASHGQQATPAPTPALTGTFAGVPFAEFARQVAATTPYRLYFDPAETDSLRVTLTATAQPVPEVLQLVLAPARLHFSIDTDYRVYITAGEPVQTQLPDNFFQAPDPTLASTAPPISPSRPLAGPRPAALAPGRVYDIGLGQAPANGKATLSGRVRDARGESVVGALVYGEVPTNGVATDQFGAYTITLPVGRQRLQVRALGFKNTARLLNLHGSGRLDVDLETDITTLKEVVVEGEKAKNVTSLRMGVTKLDVKDIKQIPTVFGEADILRVVLLLPGVKSIGEGNTGFSVRGGGADQNLVLYNDAVIYNPSHLFGFFSAFNADMLKSAELYKSTVPARYGGRLSSVLDVVTRDGNRKQFSGAGGIGLLTSRLTLEGPLGHGKGSWLVGGRTTYSDWLLRQLPSRNLQNSAAGFSDLSGHLAYDLNDHNSLYATAYYSRDRFRLATDTVYNYQNLAGSLKWKHTLSDKLYGVLTGTFSRYQYAFRSDRNPTRASEVGYNLNQGGVQLDFTRFAGAHTVEFGGSSILYRINPGQLTALGDNSLVVSKTIPQEQALESALYVADRFDLTPRLSVDAGLRYSLFNALGPRDVLTYQPGLSRSEGTVTGLRSYGRNQALATYHGPEWRAAAKYMLADNMSVKASYNRTRQYIHQLTNTTVVSPTDNWKLSDNYILPQVADQFSLGFYRNLRSNSIELSVETYYKKLYNFLDYKDGATLLLNPHLETDVVNARGRAYGAEFLVRKTTGKLNGWLSYTYARSLVQVNTATDQVNEGRWYPSNYDKPHDVTLVGNFRFNRRISTSLNFNYSTGRPITLPLSQYYLNGVLRVFYSERNAYRVPDYYRVDLAFNLEGNHKIKKLAHGSWTLAIYNVLGRRNPYSIYFQAQQGQINGYQLAIFGQPIPTVTYNFRF